MLCLGGKRESRAQLKKNQQPVCWFLPEFELWQHKLLICSCTSVCWNSVRWKIQVGIIHRPACLVSRTACFGPELIVKEYTRSAATFQSLLLLIVSHCCQSRSHASHEMQVCFLLWKTCCLQLNRALKIHSRSHSWGGFFFDVFKSDS